MVSGEALKKLQEQIAAWPMMQRFVVQQLIRDYLMAREDVRAYEDTGLTPEEFAAYWAFIQDLISDQKASEALSRLRQLAQADKDDRLVVLPSDKALTNADIIRTATNQQLAKLLYENQKEFCRLMYKNLGFEDELEFSEDYSDILAWLETPVEAEKALEAMKK
jgi:hypothetical protein